MELYLFKRRNSSNRKFDKQRAWRDENERLRPHTRSLVQIAYGTLSSKKIHRAAVFSFGILFSYCAGSCLAVCMVDYFALANFLLVSTTSFTSGLS